MIVNIMDKSIISPRMFTLSVSLKVRFPCASNKAWLSEFVKLIAAKHFYIE